MAIGLFAYERFLGGPPSFLPNDVEAIWELAGHRYVYIEVRPEHAGRGMHTVFVSDFDSRLAQIVPWPDRYGRPAQHALVGSDGKIKISAAKGGSRRRRR